MGMQLDCTIIIEGQSFEVSISSSAEPKHSASTKLNNWLKGTKPLEGQTKEEFIVFGSNLGPNAIVKYK